MASEVKRLFGGSWVCYKSENVGAVFDKMGAPQATRDTWLNSEITSDVTVEGDTITTSGKAGQMTFQASFKLGQEFKPSGGFIEKGITTFSNGVLTNVLTPADKSLPQQTVTRKIVDGIMVQTTTVDGVVSTRYFKKA